jgi:hypothetical protein
MSCVEAARMYSPIFRTVAFVNSSVLSEAGSVSIRTGPGAELGAAIGAIAVCSVAFAPPLPGGGASCGYAELSLLHPELGNALDRVLKVIY